MSHANDTVSPDFEVVVAHYMEDLSWLELLASDTIVYTKGVPYHCHKFRRGIVACLIQAKNFKRTLLTFWLRLRRINHFRAGQL